jgi:DNA-binding CsgD family transcriptional regulator
VEAETQHSVGTVQAGEEHAHLQGVEGLVVALVERAKRTEVRLSDSDIVLDLTVRGIRCLLIRSDGPPAVAVLSPREREIARMVATGLTNRSIAHVLDISPWTVSTHLRRIFAKLSVTSRAAMVAQLVLRGLPRELESRLCQEDSPCRPAATPNRSAGSRASWHAGQ